jgi:hypothetical protein
MLLRQKEPFLASEAKQLFPPAEDNQQPINPLGTAKQALNFVIMPNSVSAILKEGVLDEELLWSMRWSEFKQLAEKYDVPVPGRLECVNGFQFVFLI